MPLEDFERELAQEQSERRDRKRGRSRSPHRSNESSRKHHRHRHHRSSRHEDSKDDSHRSKHRHKRSRHDHGREDEKKPHHRISRHEEGAKPADVDAESEEDEWVEKELNIPPTSKPSATASGSQRDSWMVEPSSLDVDYVQRKRKSSPRPHHVKATEQPATLEVHQNELNHALQEDSDGEDEEASAVEDKPAQHEVDYTFGDAGSSWRMTKLRAILDKATQTGRRVEDIALERYSDLRSFDDAREEEIELERRKTYGKDYVGKEKPSGDLYQERKLDNGNRRESPPEDESEGEFEAAQGEAMSERPPPAETLPLDQTALNKLKAQMMKAKLKGGPDAARLEAEYNDAMARAANQKQPDVVVLNKMESRMLAGGRKGEVKNIDNKRGRERGLVEENEDMSIDDMVRQERRTKGQLGGDGQAFAERIAKDAKFDNDLEYMDENAVKLSKSVQKSEINLRNTAISDYQKMKRILDTCPLCHHEDTDTPPLAPLVSLGTRMYLTLPTSPEITPHGLCASIVPIQHRKSLLDCDEDEWEEVRNFMKALSRFYYAQKPAMSVIFYENAAHEGRRRHASMEAVPLPMKFADTVPAFFKEAILAADEEWTQHRKIIDTQSKAINDGLGKLAFRRSMVSDLPYFHVWFTLDGGYGHVVEDSRRWPKGDLFAREIIGGMLDVGPEIIKRQGRWKKGDSEMQNRVQKFKKGWDKFDWTHALMDPQ